jgi:hypothetical protein
VAEIGSDRVAISSARRADGLVAFLALGARPGAQLNQATGMTDRIRIIKHEAVPDCGSFEVRFPDDRPTSVTGSLSSAFSSACSLQ